MSNARERIKSKLLELSEAQLNQWFQRVSVKCEDNDEYFAITDLLKEVCGINNFNVDNVITFGD